MRKAEHGFALIELLVVLVIVVLVAAISFPSLNAKLPGRAATRLSERIAAAMLASRMQALAKNKTESIEFDVTTRTFTANGTSLAEIPPSISVELLTARGEEFSGIPSYRFFPDGSSTGGSVKLTSNEALHTVKIRWLTGQVELESGRISQ
jgi:general secretion pathway protein H